MPLEFVEARIAGAQVAAKIVELASLSLQNLQTISLLESDRNYEEAIAAVGQEVIRNKEARQEAVRLSNYLDQMAKNLSDIKPRRARDLATEAVGLEVQLINRLISYNDELNNLFELLKAKFENKIKNGEDRLRELVLLLNQETNTINNLNQKFIKLMTEFDQATSAKSF